MILEVRVNNFLVYGNETNYSLKANMQIKKFCNNVHLEGGFNVLKSSCIYGGNNVGKTCMIRAINSIRCVLLNKIADVTTNIFTDSQICSLGITFLWHNHVYEYDFKFDNNVVDNVKKGFIYEKLTEVIMSKSNNIIRKNLFTRDIINDEFYFADNKQISELLPLIAGNNILIYTINVDKYPEVAKFRNIFVEFASSIDVLDMNNIPIEKTIEVMKSNEKIRDKTIQLIKLADLDIDDYQYNAGNNDLEIKIEGPQTMPQEDALRHVRLLDDMTRLISVHKGRSVRSISFDSTGTKKVVALASYIVEALMNGKVLVVDELDSSLHFNLTKAIVSLFNNDANENAQLIFTIHDLSLLDCKHLFRKDQIWFASKDRNGAKLTSLREYTAAKNSVRSNSDLADKYRCGEFTELPEPDLIDILVGDEQNE